MPILDPGKPMARKSLVLLIYNNERVRDEIAERLVQADYHVRHAYGKRDGIPMLYRTRPDVVLLEMASAPDEGWDILSHIRLFTETTVMLMAESSDTIDWERGKRLGATGFVDLTNGGQLLAGIQDCLERFRASSARPSAADSVDDVDGKGFHGKEHRSLSDSELRQVDRAIEEVGERGEVRLIKVRGRLCFIASVKTRPYAPGPV